MAKETTSFRISDQNKQRLSELAELFRESNGEVIERAIAYLYENRVSQAKLDLEKRLRAMEKAKSESKNK